MASEGLRAAPTRPGGRLAAHGTALLWTLAFLALTAATSCFHEVWRDEVRALSLTADSGSLAGLFAGLRNEGHPCLWYLILHAGWNAFHSALVLKAASLLVAACAAFVFLERAPFPWRLRLLFLLGYFPVYEYSVVSRHYGLGMLMLFILCSLYPRRRELAPWVGAAVLLLANTNAYMLILATAFFLSLAAESLASEERPDAGRAFGLALALAGIATAYLQVWPDRTTIFDGVFHPTWRTVSSALLRAVFWPGRTFHNAVFFDAVRTFVPLTSLCLTALLWGLYLRLLSKPRLLVIAFVSVTGWVLLSRLAYGGMFLRHQGSLFLLLVALLWLEAEEDGPSRLRDGLLFCLLLVQAAAGCVAVGRELFEDYSSSKRFCEFLRGAPALKDAVLLAEPGVLLEPIPYYAPNRTYLPREGRYGRVVSFTTKAKRDLSLEELLAAGRRLGRETGKPVLLLLGMELRPDGPFSVGLTGGRFTYSPAQLAEFGRSARKVAGFHDAFHGENFDVFLLEAPRPRTLDRGRKSP